MQFFTCSKSINGKLFPTKELNFFCISKVSVSSATEKSTRISFTVNNLSSAVSGKLQNGDIITIFVLEQDADKAIQPGALTYMQVVTTTTADGIDQDSIVENEDGSYSLPSTVTVLANAEQAKLLATYEENATIHVAFVYRGDKKVADQFLAVQDAYFIKDEVEPEIPDEEEPVVVPLEGGETDG